MAHKKNDNLLEAPKIKSVRHIYQREAVKLFDNGAEIVITRARKRKTVSQWILGSIFKLISLILAFSALFYVIFSVLKASHAEETPRPPALDAGADVGATTEGGDSEILLPSSAVFVLDESGLGVQASKIDTEGYSLAPLIGNSKDVVVIVIHSHSSERVSKTQGVCALGEKLCKNLNDAGIKTYHCAEKLDKNGVIGAYENMKIKINALLETYPSALCVIDLHNSDTEKEITFSIGVDEKNGWHENLTLALAVARRLKGEESGAIRLLPSALGQDHGVLSLHIGIGRCDGAEEDAMSNLDNVTQAILNICR